MTSDPSSGSLDAILHGLTAERCHALARYWAALPRIGLLPLRSAFDPTEIPRLLPHILLHDLRTPGKSILRVVGTRVVDRFGMDPTGRDYCDFVPEDRREKAYRELWAVASHPCAMRVTIRADFKGGHATTAEAAGFPLQTEDGAGRYLVFVDDLSEVPEHWDRRAEPLDSLTVIERNYIDIGAGVPGVATP